MGTSIEFHKVADRSGPEPERDPETGELKEPWPLKHVTLVGEAPEQHDFPEGFVMKAVAEGWCDMAGGQLIFHTEQGDVVYEITSPPDDLNEDGSRSAAFSADLVTTVDSEEAE